MNVINESNVKMVQQIEESNKQMAEITKVIGEIENKAKIINDIVFQTKLLSFNAAIEDARAGEHGRGFSVVAEEVGNLSRVSGEAAKDITLILDSGVKTVNEIISQSKEKVETLAHDSKNKVEFGISVAQKCGEALELIVNEASIMEDLVRDISSGVVEQSKGLNEVSSAMGLLDHTSHENSEISRNNLESSKELQNRVLKMSDAIDVLSLMVTVGKKNKN